MIALEPLAIQIPGLLVTHSDSPQHKDTVCPFGISKDLLCLGKGFHRGGGRETILLVASVDAVQINAGHLFAGCNNAAFLHLHCDEIIDSRHVHIRQQILYYSIFIRSEQNNRLILFGLIQGLDDLVSQVDFDLFLFGASKLSSHSNGLSFSQTDGWNDRSICDFAVAIHHQRCLALIQVVYCALAGKNQFRTFSHRNGCHSTCVRFDRSVIELDLQILGDRNAFQDFFDETAVFTCNEFDHMICTAGCLTFGLLDRNAEQLILIPILTAGIAGDVDCNVLI